MDWTMSDGHFHNIYEIVFQEEGKNTFLVKDMIYDLNMNDVILFKPNVYHKSIGKGFTRICVYFTDEFLRQHFTPRVIDAALICFNRDVISLNNDDFTKVKRLLAKLEHENITVPNNLIFKHLLDLLLLLSQNKNEPKQGSFSSSHEKLTRILAYIHENYSVISNIEEIANHFYITKYYLCHLFKKRTKMTITQYLTDIKIKHACDMLANSGRTISEISMLCGYNSPIYFCTTFKRSTGMTPTEFRSASLTG